MAEATKRPWRYGLVPEERQNRQLQESPRSGDKYFIAPVAGGSDIAEVHHTYEKGERANSKANAELIVRAVNRDAAFDALLEAAKAIQPQLDALQIAGCSGSDIFTVHIKAREVKAFQSAVSLAEEGAETK